MSTEVTVPENAKVTSMMKTLRFFLLFLFVLSFSFTLTVSDQCEKDSCTKALIQTLEGTIDKRFRKLEADMEVIIRGLNLSQNLQGMSVNRSRNLLV